MTDAVDPVLDRDKICFEKHPEDGADRICVRPKGHAPLETPANALIDVVMHEVLREDFEAWLNSRGLILHRTPAFDESPELPTYNVAPSPALWEAHRAMGSES